MSSRSIRRVRPCAIASIAACLRFFEAGLVDEVRALDGRPKAAFRYGRPGDRLSRSDCHAAGDASLEQTIERVQARTRQFAKRQATWFRGLAEVEPVPVNADAPAEAIAAGIVVNR